MQSGRPELIEWLRATIRRDGPVTFAWLMEQALYHPAWGYYSSGRCAIGRHGDYFTNVSVGPIFGRMLTAQFAEMWKILGRPTPFTIVEQGANNGDFAADVLRAAATTPEFSAALRYVFVEPFPTLRQQQAEKLAELGAVVSWRENLEGLEPFTGVHFSNELLDAMPVHLIRNGAEGWQELFVHEAGGELEFLAQPLSGLELVEFVRELPPLPLGYETEVNLAARSWVDQVARTLTRGYVIAVDYGYPRAELYAADRTTGTLRCVAQHRVLQSPLAEIGLADLTAHVEWTSLAERGLTSGLDLVGFTDQHHFLSALATGLCAREFSAGADARSRRMLQTLLHPTMLGRTFQFLAFSRGVAAAHKLDGFRLASDPARALELTR